MTYFATLATTVIGFAAAGVALSLGAVIAIVPVAVFVAIRVSGALTEKWNGQSNRKRTPTI
jgi:multisubunit Na+/H+ antiporter MnhB subunit